MVSATCLVSLRASTIWLISVWVLCGFSPVNRSLMGDFGYDVSDYEEIDSIFGSLRGEHIQCRRSVAVNVFS